MQQPISHANLKYKALLPGLMFCLILFSISNPLFAQQSPKAVNWDSLQFLLGDWVGEGGGEPGQGEGSFSFSLDLQKQIVVRKNHSAYPATKERPAYQHDDLMIIYQESTKPIRAIYFDNEGHIINYTVELSKDGNALIFLSDLIPSAPRFRLTYSNIKTDKLSIKFEIAPPGKPEGFSPYIEAKAHRK